MKPYVKTCKPRPLGSVIVLFTYQPERESIIVLIMTTLLSKFKLHSLSSVKKFQRYFTTCLSKHEHSGKNLIDVLELTGILLK